MPEFQLYQKRNFNAYINDCIQFFKLFGKNYFKNYITINGALLLVLSALYYFTFRDLFGNMMHPETANDWLLSDNNIFLVTILFLLFFLVSIASSILSIGQPIVYVKLFEKTGRNDFTASEILQEILKIAGKIIVFGLISFFILFPVIMVYMLLSMGLSLILVGIPLLIIGFPALMVLSIQALIVYIYEDAGYFEALGKAWKILFSNFWHIVGSSIIIYIFVSIVQSAIFMVPYFMMMASFISSGSNLDAFEFPPSMVFLYVLGMVVTYLMLNIFYIQQTLVYYSAIEDIEHLQAISEIDNIGGNEA
ncbi:MAG TPA: hypothetical protein P5084_06405 [Paludibacter sp.]|nr:hypothetical protein [Paludibacter sp.]